jgi:hypothetical protein
LQILGLWQPNALDMISFALLLALVRTLEFYFVYYFIAFCFS